jgi:group I intron endonuclease
MAKKKYGTFKKYHFIYKTTNLLSGKYYIGMHSTDNLNDGYLGSGTLLRRALNKYGRKNFKLEILEFCLTRDELVAREREVVSLQEIAKKECINLKVGGQGGFKDAEHAYKFHAAGGKAVRQLLSRRHVERLKTDEEYRDSIVKKLKERESPFKGKKHTPETVEKMKQSHKGAGKGNKNSQYGTCWITNEVENRKIKKEDQIPEGWRLGRKVK